MAGEGTGSGAAGAAADGFNEAQLEKIRELVGTVVNGAISSRDKQADKKREQDKNDIKKMLDESLAAFKGASSGEGGEGEGKGKGKDKDSVQFATLQRQLEEMKTRSDTFERKALEERTKSRQSALSQSVQQALAVHGIEGNRARGALALLKTDNRIGFESDDEDNIVFRSDDGIGVSLDVGLRQWVKTEEARVYLPPPNTRGSGSRPGGTNGQTVTKEEAASQFWEAVGATVSRGG